MTSVDSKAYFSKQWKIWKYLGIYAEPRLSRKKLYWSYSIFLNIMVTILYPLHLAVLLFRNDTTADNIKNLAISLTTIACSLKFISFAINLKKMQKIEKILNELDSRVKGTEESNFYNNVLDKKMRITANAYIVLFISVAITAELTTFMGKDKVLLYPGWFPFDWSNSTLKYLFVHIYQFGGICIAIAQNFANETTPALLLCLLSGHIKLLKIRISKCCGVCGDLQENESELLRCIKDQINLYKLCDLIEELITFPTFIQISVSAANICVALAALLFYLNDYFDRIYYFIYVLALTSQIFPTCYFSSDFQVVFEQLPYAVFCSNWIGQSKLYKKHMILFAERSLRHRTLLVGGILPLNLDTYVAACKGAYSLFAFFLNFKG